MAIAAQLYTPISVVVAGSLIGAGLFLGLRGPPASSALAAASLPAAVASVATVLDRSAAQRAAEQALESQRAAVIASCIPPGSRGGSASRLHINIAFDHDGKQVTRGIIPERSDPRRELAECASDALPSLTIPAQNAPAALDLLWTLP